MIRRRPEQPWPPRDDEAYRAEAEAAVGRDLCDLLARVELMVYDADGVLTPGKLVYGPGGEALKEFHTLDGLGIVLARTAGIKQAVLTGRNSIIVRKRAEELRFASIKLARFDKGAAMEEILQETGCSAEHTLYMGDDLIDVPALDLVGVPVATPEAPQDVRDRCLHVTRAQGGRGAVREMTDLVLKSAGLFGTALARLGEKAWQPRPDETASADEETLQ
ncbi:MAG: HAD hydrolase family protein [Candidatus Krumholzibacteriia bacterium]